MPLPIVHEIVVICLIQAVKNFFFSNTFFLSSFQYFFVVASNQSVHCCDSSHICLAWFMAYNALKKSLFNRYGKNLREKLLKYLKMCC